MLDVSVRACIQTGANSTTGTCTNVDIVVVLLQAKLAEANAHARTHCKGRPSANQADAGSLQKTVHVLEDAKLRYYCKHNCYRVAAGRACRG